MFWSIANHFCRLRETVPLHRVSTCGARVFRHLPPHLLDMGNQGSDDELEFAGVTVTGWSLPLAFKKGINARDVIPTICDLENCQRLEDGGERGTALAVRFVTRKLPLRDRWPYSRATGADLRMKHLPRR